MKSTEQASGRTEYIFTKSAAASDAFSRRTAAADASHLVPHLRPGMRVLDLGCGAGSITIGLATLVAPGDVLGFDLSETAVAQARARAEQADASNAHFAVADLCSIDLPAERFDVAHFNGVLAHLSQPRAALHLAYRALKPGGLIAAREPQKAADWFAGPSAEAVRALNRLTIDEWQARGGDPCLGRRLGPLLRQAGFERIEVTPGYSPALSRRECVGEFAARRLTEPDVVERFVRGGRVSTDQLATLVRGVADFAACEDSVAALAECMAIAIKPVAGSC